MFVSLDGFIYRKRNICRYIIVRETDSVCKKEREEGETHSWSFTYDTHARLTWSREPDHSSRVQNTAPNNCVEARKTGLPPV